MYYILYEGLKIESNEPVYCTLYSRPVRSIQFFLLPVFREYINIDGIFLNNILKYLLILRCSDIKIENTAIK